MSYSRQHASIGGGRKRDGNMPALKEISFEYARQIASVKGLQPGKVRGTSTLRFTKGDSDKLQVITWDEFVRTANNRNLAVYESGGWVKWRRQHRSSAIQRRKWWGWGAGPPPRPPSSRSRTHPEWAPSFLSPPRTRKPPRNSTS